MRLFAGSSRPEFARSIADGLGTTLGTVSLKSFESGERYVRFEESLKGEDVCIVQPLGKHPHEALFELFLLCHAAKLGGAKHVRVVLPYFPYARQDRMAQEGEPVSAQLVAELLEKAGADHVLTLHLHSERVRQFFTIPIDSIDPLPLFAAHLSFVDNPVIVSPDAGGAPQARALARLLGTDTAALHKTRSAHHEATIGGIDGDVAGRRCILFDDLIDTAGTLVAAKEALIAYGAEPGITVAATHGLFSGPAIARLESAAFERIIVTDSLPHEKTLPALTVLPSAGLFVSALSGL